MRVIVVQSISVRSPGFPGACWTRRLRWSVHAGWRLAERVENLSVWRHERRRGEEGAYVEVLDKALTVGREIGIVLASKLSCEVVSEENMRKKKE